MSLGVGIACITSVGPRFSLAVEVDCLAQSLCRRLGTPRDNLSWAPNDCTDMREFVNRKNTPANRFAAQSAAHDECLKDERVQDCSVTAQFNFAASTLTLTIAIVTANGPFKLVFLVDAYSVSIVDATLEAA